MHKEHKARGTYFWGELFVCGGYTRVCVHCGACGKVESCPILDTSICPLCGHKNDSKAKQCSECGVALSKAPGVQLKPQAYSVCCKNESKKRRLTK